jgi:RNase P protein component
MYMDIPRFWACLEPMGREVSSRYQKLIIIFRNNFNNGKFKEVPYQSLDKLLKKAALFFHPADTP